MPFITIVMPTYNQGKYIRKAVNSVLQQDCRDFELLVYDAVSTDETPAVLRGYRAPLVWVREKDRGMSEAINKGLKAAKGEVLAWLCSDDAYLPGTFAKVKAAFEADPSLDFVYGDSLEMDQNGVVFTPNFYTEDPCRKRYLYSHNYICQPTLFLRRRVVDKVGMVREDLQLDMDYQWFARFHLADLKARRLPHFLAANRDYPLTKTNANGMRRYLNMLKIHRMRPGPPLPLRKAFWVYTFEAMIKGCNAARLRRAPRSLAARIFGTFARIGGRWFLLFVNPRSRRDIAQRFERDIKPLGRSLEDMWRAAGGDLDAVPGS